MLSINNQNFIPFLLNFELDESYTLFSKPKTTVIKNISIDNYKINKFTNEFWTAKQRQSNSLHEISYRACFKAQLPNFFIELLTKPGDVVYDPFAGRGTTIIESGLLNRNIISNDINPLSRILSFPRFFIPNLNKLEERLGSIKINKNNKADIDLSMFYHPKTEAELVSLKKYLDARKKTKNQDYLDEWIRMVATNRLTGHSSGFFSVYTLPPNQAVSANSQLKINKKRKQKPQYRDIKKLIFKKSKQLINNLYQDLTKQLESIGKNGLFIEKDARKTTKIKDETVKLVITSPPFLDIVQYANDNWLRCWFNSIDTAKITKDITVLKKIVDWNKFMGEVFNELFRVVKKGGYVAFEVGEVRKGEINLDEHVVPLGIKAGFNCDGIVVNDQKFTKTANIWGIKNNGKGTNTNRIVIFKK